MLHLLLFEGSIWKGFLTSSQSVPVLLSSLPFLTLEASRPSAYSGGFQSPSCHGGPAATLTPSSAHVHHISDENNICMVGMPGTAGD